MQISLFFFAASAAGPGGGYRLLLDAARAADRHGFTAVWTPERHFGAFGGLYANPSVTGAALAAATSTVQIRAGSVVMPLQDPLRVAEEWAMVDNLSGGRAGVSFASGWHVNDFVLAPAGYEARREETLRGMEVVRRLWRGESVTRRNGAGREVEVSVFPRPVQAEIPVWLTAQSDSTFGHAAELGVHVLTNYNYKSPSELERRVALYREGMLRHHGRPGHVTLMAHTYVGPSAADAHAAVRPALTAYLAENLALQGEAALGAGEALPDLTDDDRAFILERAVDRFIAQGSVIGDAEECGRRLARLAGLGVDEVACLVDFGVEPEAALAGVDRLAAVHASAGYR